MTLWICDRCGIEQPGSPEPPHCVLDRGEVGIEERGDLGPHSGSWRTHEQLAAEPHVVRERDHGRGVHSLRREPVVGIGQWSFVVRTARGNVLWDPPTSIEPDTLAAVRALGEVVAIATSHPHMFAAQVSWSHAFGRVPVLVNAAGREWLGRTDPVLEFWTGHAEPVPGVELIQVGGHMLGSAVLRTQDGTILSGDSISGGLAPNWVSFQRNFPKHIPLSAAVVRRIVDRLDGWSYDRLYTLGGDTIDADAKAVVHRSADAHIRWVSGEFDHLT